MPQETIQSLKKKLEVLEAITKTISYNLNINEILKKIVDLVSETCKADSCLIYLSYSENSLILKASKILHPQAINKLIIQSGEGITGWVARYREKVVIEEKAYQDKRFLVVPTLPEDNWEAFVSMPIIYQNKIVGVINVQHKKKKKYSGEEIILLETIASQVGGAISNAKLTEALKEALENRKIIDKAKGILMEKKGISEEQAYRLMQKKAMNSKKSMREIADTLLFVFDE